jgi:hypothetical protein
MQHLPIGTLYTDESPYLVTPEARKRHMAIFGKSGVGKTTLMRNMILCDIAGGLGVTVIDPHGSLIDDLLDHIPRSRTNDVIYFNPHQRRAVPSINILERVSEEHRPLVVSALTSTLKNIWPDNWGPQTDLILSSFAFALLEQPEPVTLLGLHKLLTRPDYRKHIAERVSDPVIRSFFDTYDHEWDDDKRTNASAPPLNKIAKLVTNPLLRNVVGQTTSSFDFRWMMDSKKILLCDLSKGALGEDVSSLLGSLLVTKLFLAALSRQDVPEDERVPHFFYIDEVHNFTYGIDLASILSEARKYRLTLTIATQTLNQLPQKTLASVFGNCATVMSFRVSGEDAEALAQEFSMTISAAQLQELPDYKLYVRTLVSVGEDEKLTTLPSRPGQVTTYPPFTNNKEKAERETIIRASAGRYCRRREEVEERIRRFLES